MNTTRSLLASVFVLGAVALGVPATQAAPVGGPAQLAITTPAADANLTQVQYSYGYPRHRYPPPPRYYRPPPRYYYPPAYYYPPPPPPRYYPPYYNPCVGLYGGGVGANFCF
jgi:hypothetical protein